METLRKEYWELSGRGQLGPRKSTFSKLPRANNPCRFRLG